MFHYSMERRCLILDFNSTTEVASCYYKEKFELLRVQIGHVASLAPGQFLVYDASQATEQNEIIIPRDVRIEEAKREDCISVKKKKIQISSWISFSSDPRHQTYGRKLAFSDWYGFVDSSKVDIASGSNAFKSFIAVKDLNYKQNETQLFKVRSIKGTIDPIEMEKEYAEFMDKMNQAEESYLKVRPQRPTRGIDNRRAENGANNGARRKPRSRSHDTGRQFDVGRHLANIALPTPSPFQNLGQEPRAVPHALPSTDIYSDPFPPVTPISFTDYALIICSESDYQVAWLTERKEAVLLIADEVQAVRLGKLYECFYEQKSDGKLEITKILKNKEGLPFEIEQDEFVKAKIRVNLCTPNTKCALWSFHSGTPFLNSPDVGIVTMDDFVDAPLGSSKSWQHALRDYLGDRRAENMLCICHLVKQNVPAKLKNSFLADDFSVEFRYMWQVKKICLSEKYHNLRKDQLKMENLGINAHEYEEEDEIARAKRENKNRVNFGSNIVHENYDQQPCSSASPFSRF